jgi:peptidoglycan L-alanyl-D-glutamate endopeptidase CwlK
MSRALDDLDPRFLPLAMELLARTVEAGIPVLIVNTRRTAAEQAAYIASGASWVRHSKHQDGLAIDIVPYDVFRMYGEDKLQWEGSDPVWQRLGKIGEAIGLRWGGRWQARDYGHFEYVTTPTVRDLVA